MDIFTTLRDKNTRADVSDYNGTRTAFSSRCIHNNLPVTTRAWNAVDGEISRNLFMRNIMFYIYIGEVYHFKLGCVVEIG